MPPAEFEPAIPTNERPQTHALDRAATGTGIYTKTQKIKLYYHVEKNWGLKKCTSKVCDNTAQTFITTNTKSR